MKSLDTVIALYKSNIPVIALYKVTNVFSRDGAVWSEGVRRYNMSPFAEWSSRITASFINFNKGVLLELSTFLEDGVYEASVILVRDNVIVLIKCVL